MRPDPGCAVCGEHPTITLEGGLPDYDAFCGLPPAGPDTARLPVVAAAELAAWLQDPARDVVLIDVREPGERAIVSIPGAVAVPRARFDTPGGLADVPFDRPVVLHCKSGARSATALRLLLDAGHPDARHLEGGVLAWVADVDPTLATY